MLKVREMVREDVERVYEINRESFTTDAWSRFSFEKDFENKFSRRFVLEEEGKVVGYVIFWIVKEEATVMTFAIDPNRRGRGYGEKLLREAINRLGDKVKRVILDVRKSNLRAINLYKKIGFKVVTERKGYYSDGENALLMELKISKPSEAKLSR
ncbi:MAG: ribosomal-protein-alanine N-acetyltransferase [Aquifex sp.]|nr:MAG: ribosomal-protein-alanine N-acetyltransferase [Aquifex sp.]